MKDSYLQSWFARVDSALGKAKTAATGDMELEGFLASYMVVFISGAYEECVEHLLGQRSAKTNDQEIRNFVESTLDESFRNPDFRKICTILKRFSENYATKFKDKVDTKARVAIDSIVTHRNNVAHGKSSQVTLSDVERYHISSLPIFEALEDILK